MDTSYPDGQLVKHTVNATVFDAESFRVVHHQLGVVSGVDNNAITPRRVTNRTASQQQVTIREGDSQTGDRVALQRPVELVQDVVWRLALDLGFNTTNKVITTTVIRPLDVPS